MQPLKARVQNGRIQLDEATELPDGDVYLVPVDELTERERADLELALAEAIADVRDGRVSDAADVMKRLEARRGGTVPPPR